MSWLAREKSSLPPFFVIGDPSLYSGLAERLGLKVPVSLVSDPAEAAESFAITLPVLPLDLSAPVTAGQLNPLNAPAVMASIDQACDIVKSGLASGLVTNPIHKRALYEAGLSVPGHTEYLAARTDSPLPVMMLSCEGLRVVPLTIHVALAHVPDLITIDLIIQQASILDAALRRDMGIKQPRIAIAGLNPHAGEEGHLGREEIEIIMPAIEKLRAQGVNVTGPHSADTMFHAAARTGYDAALCMYHDQALIPIKTLDFEHGVNTTLGLPIIRTSPDHGTALDIAGQGKAHPGSLIAALKLANVMAINRAHA